MTLGDYIVDYTHSSFARVGWSSHTVGQKRTTSTGRARPSAERSKVARSMRGKSASRSMPRRW